MWFVRIVRSQWCLVQLLMLFNKSQSIYLSVSLCFLFQYLSFYLAIYLCACPTVCI